jgi:SAM-dependent methyltransferase
MSGAGVFFRTARRIARQPAVRRLAEPLAAQYFALRSRGLDARGRWHEGSTFEVAHWDSSWLEEARANGLLDPEHPLTDAFVLRALDEVPVDVDPVRILDVGAGPLTPLGKVHPQRNIKLTASDALAEQYDAMLGKAGIVPPVRTVPADGERLVEVFGESRFDVVHCGNALDHHYEPLVALEQMLAVAKPQGVVLLNHFLDEGEFQRYLGMHQWNINSSDGRLLIWNKQHSHDVTALLEGRAVVENSLHEVPGQRSRLHTVIRKL